ncbi:MAG: Holliday junction branch migration protein RuvA [Ruminococcaceae bacterium]|nr:Holliday junction branch migration protein RuvA [Oscillospiraceae bacterium]
MIASLNGILTYLEPTYCIIECYGVGYKCFITGKTLGAMPKIGENFKLFTFLSVREDAMDLYGFSDMNELECFKLITSVSGVGPKIGIALLTSFSPEQVSFYISNNQPKALTAASGVGIKLAQRIILELKDKVSASITANEDFSPYSATDNNDTLKEAVAALVSLGFSQSEASNAVKKLDGDLSVDSLIKEALKLLSRQV